MIPDLDELGLLPAGIHSCTLTQVRAAFCWNAHRHDLLDSVERFLKIEWGPLGMVCPIFLDGSFVRSKAMPGDVDIVIDLSGVDQTKALGTMLLVRQQHGNFKKAYHCDVWTKHPLLPKDLLLYFQYVGEKAAAELNISSKTPKGVLRLVL